MSNPTPNIVPNVRRCRQSETANVMIGATKKKS